MLPRACSLVVPLVALLVLPSCGGRSAEGASDQSGGASAGRGGAVGGGAGASPGGATPGGSDAGGSDSGGGFVGGAGASAASTACDAYLDQSGTTVQLELVNDTQQAIYLGPRMPGCGGEQIQVADATGALLVPGFCQATCQNVIQGTTPLCPPIACPVNSTVTLQPGELTLVEWGGAFLRDASLPLACLPANAATDCQRIEGVTPGVYTFSAIAGTKLDCSQLGGAPCERCMPSSAGGCWTPAAVITGPFLTATTEVLLGGSYGVGDMAGGIARPVQVRFGN